MLKQLLEPISKLQLITIFIGLSQICLADVVTTHSCLFDETPFTIWNGTEWSNDTPNLATNAIISGNYNTATNGGFSAFNLIINAGFRLTIDNNTFVEIENNVDVIGEIIVETAGAFIQNNDSSAFYVDSAGMTKVNKTTSVLNNWYDYTYWSSPVLGTTVNQAFVPSNVNRGYWFNAQNYLDILKEDANNNIMVAGHDDIDDNGDDWQLIAGTDVLQPGVGYATTHSSGSFEAGNAYPYSFQGPFNNGIIYTPIYYNGDNGDNDWNFIGNPYPSAISADAFFSANTSVIGGAVYLWSHGNPPSATNNGQDTYNFSSDDYAIINAGSGEVAGGSGVIPNRYIPSGQGFFVQGLGNGNIVFNNAMRMKDNSSNSQFFRLDHNLSNKIWLNLTTESGLFNQVLIAYVDGATNENDGPYFDAPRNLSTGTAAIIYTSVEDDFSNKLAIQGKAANSISIEETIPLGFYTGINENVTYELSIPKTEGTFFESNNVYLVDHLLNNIHNLTESSYQFDSDTGEFNARFTIMFNPQTLSIANNNLNNELIVKQDNGSLVLETTNGQLINSVQLVDQSGKIVNQLQPKKTSEIINTQYLSAGFYVANIILNNGFTDSKKIIIIP
jgi:hypothetical protein